MSCFRPALYVVQFSPLDPSDCVANITPLACVDAQCHREDKSGDP